MKVKIFPAEGCAGILKAALKRDDGTVTRWVEAPFPVTLDVTDEELRGIERAQTIRCEMLGEPEDPEVVALEGLHATVSVNGQEIPGTIEQITDGRTITIGTLANKAGEGIGPACIIEAAAELGITLDRKSRIPVSQAEAILARLKGE